MNKNTKEPQNYHDDEDFNYEYDDIVDDDTDKIFNKFENSKKHLTISKNEKNLNLNNKIGNSEQIDSSHEVEKPRKNSNEIQTNKNIGVHYLHNIDKLKSNDMEEDKEEEEVVKKEKKTEKNKVLKLPKFDISQFSQINAGAEIKEFITIMKKFEPKEFPIDAKLKPFIPNYIPIIGDTDAILKIDRPDHQNEELGLKVIDEPIPNGIDPSIFSLELAYKLKLKPSNYKIKSIEEAEKHPKKIQNWIEQISNLHKEEIHNYVSYSKPMPNIESLMQIWPENFEEILRELQLPDETINLSLQSYAGLVCNILDIPIHKINSNKSIIEALHVFFSLYSEFKENQHFQLQNNKKADENIQTKKFY